MLLTDVYQLEYTAKEIPQHVLYQIEGIRHKALDAYSIDNIKAAEWLLDYIEYSSKDLIEKHTAAGTISNNTGRIVGNYLKHIHANCRQVIQSRFNTPLLDDEQAGYLFLDNMLKDYWDKIAVGEKIDIDRDFQATSKPSGALRIDVESKLKRYDFREDAAGLSLQSILTGQW